MEGVGIAADAGVAELGENLAFLGHGDVGFKFDLGIVVRRARFPGARLDAGVEDELVGAIYEVAAVLGDEVECHEVGMNAQMVFEVTNGGQGRQTEERGENSRENHAGACSHADAGDHKDRGGAGDAQDGAAFAKDHTRADEAYAGNNLSGNARVVAAEAAGHDERDRGKQCRAKTDEEIGANAGGLVAQLALEADNGAEESGQDEVTD